jgi:hypothetical protein
VIRAQQVILRAERHAQLKEMLRTQALTDRLN